MVENANNLAHSPQYGKHRTGVTAVDGLPATLTTKRLGMACEGYLAALIQVIPSGGANPTVEVLTWSDEAGHFVPQVAAAVVAGPGANLPFEFEFFCRSRYFFVRFTVLAGGSCEVVATGSELDHLR